MTLIVSVPTAAGVVMASDGQITAGVVRASGQKIYALNQSAAWAGAGELALIQRVQEALSTGPGVDHSLEAQRDHLSAVVKGAVSSLLQLDFRTQFCQGSEALLSLHPGDFVFAEYRTKPRVLHISSDGTPEWIEERPFATGNGALFAYALLRKYHDVHLSVEQASILAFKVIEETIEVGSYGLGPRIDIWQIQSSETVRLDESRIAALADASETLRTLEVRLLVEDLGGLFVPEPQARQAEEGNTLAGQASNE